MITKIIALLLAGIGCIYMNKMAFAEDDFLHALKRSGYLLAGRMPNDAEFEAGTQTPQAYREHVRKFIQSPGFYDSVLRYHERIFGIGLPEMYLEELQNGDLNDLNTKFAKITCRRGKAANERYRCFWAGRKQNAKVSFCPEAMEQTVSAFWKPGVVAWVCPSISRACGADLSRCFIQYEDADEARNAELGASEIFDSKVNIIKSLAKQPAGIATAVVHENFPYTKILEPGLTAVDGSLAHFYRQAQHFNLEKLNLSANVLSQVNKISLTDTRFRLIYSGRTSETAGILTTFSWLRRYEKNRTRANQLYERLLCRKLSAELPKVFPQDPGDLRTREGCKGCHATLDPLSDFFGVWGEGGDLYKGIGGHKVASFNGQSGTSIAELADIIRSDRAFAACTVQNVWEWLVGRKFFKSEEPVRDALTDYFTQTKYSFRELVYAVSTHPTFTSGKRADATVTEPLDQPPLGKAPDANSFIGKCKDTYTFAADILPKLTGETNCRTCHTAEAGRQLLNTEQDWKRLGKSTVDQMSSGSMPPGQSGPPSAGQVYDLKEAVRCWLEKNP
jgi:hypothetical protein